MMRVVWGEVEGDDTLELEWESTGEVRLGSHGTTIEGSGMRPSARTSGWR